MVLIAWPRNLASTSRTWPTVADGFLLVAILSQCVYGMSNATISSLRQDTRNLFYHGYSNYLAHAFPEDELKPLSCQPQTRNRDNPADIGLNDVLGNYSLTLIDSLSSLAILASEEHEIDGRLAWRDFQSGVQSLVELYGDGSPESCGSRACGFDLDSKVQVFETNIRGVGGLLSAHLFATGELPVRGYNPNWIETPNGLRVIDWNGWLYNDQLLQLAYNLALRLLPAFGTPTGLPYPRVNLRTGIPFYGGQAQGVCHADGSSTSPEITETCSAGAGSLVLEFSTLSRLTGDPQFEILAKNAFQAVWDRRSNIGLVGAGIDAESGQWIAPALAGVGAGVDSFYEYALKSHILLSNVPDIAVQKPENESVDFLVVWEAAHAAVKRHVYRNSPIEKHPYYGQVDLITGAPRYSWIDALSAYYPGLLTLAGELDEAIEAHLLYAALWTRYSAIPERWQVFNSFIDPNFKFWAGRPEFIESTYYLYQATKDPFYLHVGEMALRDIRRRCWTKCGWADLRDVISGEKRDRMESFFLGETAKYLYLLFDPSHPLNRLDEPVVFTTEGHPLTIPRSTRRITGGKRRNTTPRSQPDSSASNAFCQVAPSPLPLTVSNVANRSDLFHAAALANLHLVPMSPTQSSPIVAASQDGPGISIADIQSPTNHTFYPWTLPLELTPAKGYSNRLRTAHISTLTFPKLHNGITLGADKDAIPVGALQKVVEGVVINSLSNVRLNMVEEAKILMMPNPDGQVLETETGRQYRILGIANWALGRDEQVILSNEAMRTINPGDPYFTRIKDLEMVDLILDLPIDPSDLEIASEGESYTEIPLNASQATDSIWSDFEAMMTKLLVGVTPSATEPAPTSKPTLVREVIPATIATGLGAAPLPDVVDGDTDPFMIRLGDLPLRKILFLDDTLCRFTLPHAAVKTHSILVIHRGDCSFNDKLANIPAAPPGAEVTQLVIVISSPEDNDEATNHDDSSDESDDSHLVRPLLDEAQRTPGGYERRHPLAMVMVDGSQRNIRILRRAAALIAAFDSYGALVAADPMVADPVAADPQSGLAVKRRFWFESLGVPIKNLIML